MAPNPTSRELEIEQLLRNSHWLQELARSLVGDAFTAEDLMQEALSHAKEEGTWTTGNLGGWVAGIVRNLARQHFRQESRRIAREQEAAHRRVVAQVSPHEIKEAPDPAYLAQKVEMQQILAQQVLALDLPSREVLLLRYYGDRSVKQIAEQLELEPRAVEARLRRARTRLRAQLENSMGKGQWALACLPLLPREMAAPPPPVPMFPTWVTVSVAAGLLFLMVTLGGWLPWQGDGLLPKESLARVEAAEPLHHQDKNQASASVERSQMVPPPTLQDPPQVQGWHFQIVDSQSHAPMPGMQPRFHYARRATPQELETQDDPRYLRVKSKPFWILETEEGLSDEQGLVPIKPPQECTVVVLDLALHTATHSLADYPRAYNSYPLSGLNAQGITLKMVPRSGYATGRVVNPKGEPIPFAKVDLVPTVLYPKDDSVSATVVANAHGEYSMTHVASNVGGFLLRPRLDEHIPVRHAQINAFHDTPQSLADIDLQLAPAVTVKLVVQDSSGVPVANAKVQAQGSIPAMDMPSFQSGRYQSNWMTTAQSNAEGIAEILVAKDRKVAFEVQAKDFVPWVQSFDTPPAIVPAVLQPDVEVRVLVTADGKPIPRARVRMVAERNFANRAIGTQAMTDAKGLAIIPHARPGEIVEFTVAAPGYQVAISPPTTILANGQELSMPLNKGLSIGGRVRDWKELYPQNGRPEVFVLPVEAESWPWDGPIPLAQRILHRMELASADRAWIQNDGTFFIDGLAPGRYRVWFGKRQMPYGLAEVMAGEEDLELRPFLNAHTTPVLYGVVRNAVTLEPEPDVRLVLTAYSDQGVLLKGNRGQLLPPMHRLQNPQGSYRLMAPKPGWYSLAAWVPNKGYTLLEPRPRYFAAGEHQVDFLMDSSTALNFRVENGEGESLRGVLVRVMDSDGGTVLQTGEDIRDFLGLTQSLAQGRVTLGSVPAFGEFQLELKYQGRTQLVAGAPLRDAPTAEPVVIFL